MVELFFTGNNTITFGRYKIAKGLNQLEKNDFVNFMKLQNFKYRVENKIFDVKNYLDILEYIEIDEEKEIENTISDESNIEKGLVRDILINIKKSEDLEFLYKLLDSDTRPRVQKALYERIDQIS